MTVPTQCLYCWTFLDTCAVPTNCRYCRTRVYQVTPLQVLQFSGLFAYIKSLPVGAHSSQYLFLSVPTNVIVSPRVQCPVTWRQHCISGSCFRGQSEINTGSDLLHTYIHHNTFSKLTKIWIFEFRGYFNIRNWVSLSNTPRNAHIQSLII